MFFFSDINCYSIEEFLQTNQDWESSGLNDLDFEETKKVRQYLSFETFDAQYLIFYSFIVFNI